MLLEVENLSREYEAGVFRTQTIHAVRNISFCIEEEDIVGLIGGSGCGKTTVTKMILGLLKPSGGTIKFQGEDITKRKRREWKELHKEIQAVFQHPQMTFNPRGTIRFACMEPAINYGLVKKREEREAWLEDLIAQVGLTRDQLKKYPHEISGGQAQRISIVRALSLKPKLLICDEPTSMLDVSVQAQILKLLKEKHEEQKMAMLFISHDLDVIRAFCNKVIVMNEGEIVERGLTEEVFASPKDNYTKELLKAVMV